MRLLEFHDLKNEEIGWEADRCLMTNMIQVNDCLADTISGGIRSNKACSQLSKFKFIQVMEFTADTNMGT